MPAYRSIALLAPLLLLIGCVPETPAARPLVGGPPPPPMRSTAGLTGVIGQSARNLTQLFGAPQLDVSEGTGRRMQFASRICVLDAYLYPRASGSGEAVVTYIDTRQRDGSTIDRASCVAALNRREGGK